MNHQNDRLHAARRAHELMKQPFVIFDVETTGFESTDEIVQVAAIDQDGQVLMHGYIKPTQSILNSHIHGITDEMVKDAPPFDQVHPFLVNALHGQTLLAYNYAFDGRMLRQDCDRHKLMRIAPAGIECVMLLYADFYGDWDDYHGNNRWQKLGVALKHFGLDFDGDAHDALNDCQAALAILTKMAGWYAKQQKHELEKPGEQPGF